MPKKLPLWERSKQAMERIRNARKPQRTRSPKPRLKVEDSSPASLASELLDQLSEAELISFANDTTKKGVNSRARELLTKKLSQTARCQLEIVATEKASDWFHETARGILSSCQRKSKRLLPDIQRVCHKTLGGKVAKRDLFDLSEFVNKLTLAELNEAFSRLSRSKLPPIIDELIESLRKKYQPTIGKSPGARPSIVSDPEPEWWREQE